LKGNNIICCSLRCLLLRCRYKLQSQVCESTLLHFKLYWTLF